MDSNNLNANSLTMTVLMTPSMVNFSGKVHGGEVLKLLDQVAYACASRFCGNYVVTLSVDQVFFRQPIHLGELVTFFAAINATGRTSMEVGIKVSAENTRERVLRHVISCFFTMVAIDEKGEPCPVPQLVLTTDIQKERYEGAQLRKQLRKDAEEAHKAIHQKYIK